ncbi:MAG: DUF4043 family protein [Leptospirillia bacterium]
MADTTAASGLTVQQWDDAFFTEYVRASRFSRYMGGHENAVIHVKENLTKQQGDRITFALVHDLAGTGTSGNGQVMMLVDGVNGYFWDGASLTAITDADYPDTASHVVFLGGYFVFDNPDTAGQFIVSTLYATDPADMVSTLDFATAESDPDGLVAIGAARGHLWLLGRHTTEVWYQSGAEFPFDPVGGGRMERGCLAVRSVARAGDDLLWLASDRNGRVQVVQTRGFGAEPVSTPAIEHAIESYATVADATAYAYHQAGHTFYVLTFPSAGATWVYDLSTGLWHRRAGWSAPNWTRHRGDTYVRFGMKHLVGDHETGKVYALDLATYTDDGTLIRRERTAPQFHAEGRPLFFSRLALDMETGVGDTATPAPKLMLDWSDDGGHTWRADRIGHLDGGAGATGEYGRRVTFHRLGCARGRTFRVTITDSVKVAIMGASVEVTGGMS